MGVVSLKVNDIQRQGDVVRSRPAERQQEAGGKVVIQGPPNLQIMAYAPKRVLFGIKAFKAF